jgi:hypothetical protein
MSPDPQSQNLAAADRRAIQALADKTRTAANVVEDLYRQELDQLEPARIRQFLPVIATRRVRYRLRQSH